MNGFLILGSLALLAGAFASPADALPWMSGLSLCALAAGFHWNPRTSFLFAAAGSAACVALVGLGCPPARLVGPWALFGLLPIILWDKNSRFAERYRDTELKREAFRKLLSQTCANTDALRGSIRKREEEIQRLIELYGLSKRFLSTLSVDQAVQITEEAISTWLDHIEETEKIRYLESLRAMLEQGGVSMNDLIRQTPASALKHGAQERWGIVISQLALGLQRVSLYKQVQESAIHDGLTGLLVRRYFKERLDEEVKRASRRHSGLVFLMVDIDHFKRINDTLGHLVGDVVLREVSRLIQKSVREIDLVGRYGGEEFAVVLPEANRELGTQIAERIRQTIEQTLIQAYDERIQITVSVGVNILSKEAASAEQLVEGADQAMYRAKRSGRNRVISTT